MALRAAQVPAPAWWPAVLLVGFRCSTGLGRPAPLLLPIGPPDKCPMLIVTSTIGVRPGGPPLVPPPGGAVVVERTHAMSQRQNGRELRFGSLSLSLSLSQSVFHSNGQQPASLAPKPNDRIPLAFSSFFDSTTSA